MSKALRILLLLHCCAMLVHGQGLPPVGQWREHLPFNNAIAVSTEGDGVWCATPYGFFSYDAAGESFTRKTRVNGLSEVRVSFMARESGTGRVALGYANSNLDILDGDQVVNIPDILLSNVAGDKRLNTGLWSDGRLLIGSGLGIIVVNADKREVSDTWRVGAGGASIPVTGIAVQGGYIHVACTEGLRRGRYPGSNLADPAAWETESGGALTPGAVARVAVHNGDLYAQKNDSVFRLKAGNWILFHVAGATVTALDDTPTGIAVASTSGGKGKVVVLDDNGSPASTLNTPSMSEPVQTARSNDGWWVADRNNGLLLVDASGEHRVFPNSPISTSDGAMYVDGKELVVTAGSVKDSWNYQYNPNGFFRFGGDYWTNVNLYVNPALDTVLDLIAVTRDHASQRLYLGSFGGGLLEYGDDGSTRIYKQGTGLQPAVGDPGSYRVSGLAMDDDGDLWISNYAAPRNLVLKKKDGSWAGFTIPFSLTENAVSQLLFDDARHLWIVSPKGNGLVCYDPGADHGSSGDDRWRYFRQGAGKGNLPSNDVNCVARDRDGFIWVGTAKGIGIMTCLDGVFDNNACELYLPVVVQNGVAGYLFNGEDVRTIAVDGANRKWVGTRKGAWLISADGERTIEHFTESNSPLLSNDVNGIAIDPATGEVFFSTFNGICSFRGGATVADSSKGGVLVFPNPVPPGYGGSIAIRGLPDNAWVRITELDGRLVYQTRSLGGQAVWDGKNYKGERVSSSAYLVLASASDNQGKVVAKIFFVR